MSGLPFSIETALSCTSGTTPEVMEIFKKYPKIERCAWPCLVEWVWKARNDLTKASEPLFEQDIDSAYLLIHECHKKE